MLEPDDERREAQIAWQAMRQLIAKVTDGGRLDPVPPTVTLRPGEYQYGALQVELHAFFDVKVEYATGDHRLTGRPLFAGRGRAAEAIRDASLQRRAEREAASQWRRVGVVRCVITSRRLMLTDGEGQWQTYPLDVPALLAPQLPAPALAITFKYQAPVRLRGPWVPWLTVVLSALQHAGPWPPGFPLPTGDGPG